MKSDVAVRPWIDFGGLASYLELTKPRVSTLVVMTTAAGFYLGSGARFDWMLLFHTLCGTALLAAGTAVLNQFLERDNDGRMHRTAGRPLPSKRLEPVNAMVFGLALIAVGGLQLGFLANPLTAFLGCLTTLVYLLAYTPLKTRTALCTTVGAFPGAMPPLMGWAAARGQLDLNGWILFAILFLWQFPHFLAIAWIYREDYQRGGFKMLPLHDREGKRTGLRVAAFSAALLLVSLAPFFTDLAGTVYLAAALGLGAAFLWAGVLLARTRSRVNAKIMLRVSVIYLPLLLGAMIADKL